MASSSLCLSGKGRVRLGTGSSVPPLIGWQSHSDTNLLEPLL